MSFPSDAAFNLGGKIVDIIGRYIPDKAKAQEATLEIRKILADAMRSEMSSAWLVGQWRAIAMLALTGGIVWRYVMGVLNFADNPVDLAIGLIWLIGLTGYGVGADTVKNLLAILRKPKEGEGK